MYKKDSSIYKEREHIPVKSFVLPGSSPDEDPHERAFFAMAMFLFSALDRIEGIERELYDFEISKDRICYSFVSPEEQKNSITPSTPCRDFYDMKICYYVVKQEESSLMTYLVTRDLLDEWKISESQLFKLAEKNTPKILPFHCSPVKKYPPFEYPEGLPKNTFIVSNLYTINGGIAILYKNGLKKFAKGFFEKYLYVIPLTAMESAVITSDSKITLKELKERKKELLACNKRNSGEISKHFFLYDREKNEVVMYH